MGCKCRRAERRKARYAREAARLAAAKGADQLEEAWGEDTSDEDEAEVARYGRERAQILEVRSASASSETFLDPRRCRALLAFCTGGLVRGLSLELSALAC